MEADYNYKQHCLRHVREERARWEALLAQVGAEPMLQPGALGEWTFKDLVAHLNGWWFYELAALEALLAGETPHLPWPADWPVDRQNRWIYEANKDRPLADVLADSRAFFERLEGLLTRLSEPVLRESAAIPWLQGRPVGMGFLDGCLEHLYGEHWPELSAWMGRLECGSLMKAGKWGNAGKTGRWVPALVVAPFVQ